VESLGKALVKHRIEFGVAELQQMMILCGKEEEEGESIAFDNNEIHESIKNMVIDYEKFKQFYDGKF
jgi:hypothetical protein